MRLVIAALVALLPAAARATNYPWVQDGPVISGVTDHDAWVAWYTAHHEGTGTQCTIENSTPILGDHNTDVPTLTLSPTGSASSYTDTNCDRYHKVHLTGLQPSTTYSFGLDKPWDQRGGPAVAGSFTTAPPTGTHAAFQFVVYGDTRNNETVAGANTKTQHQTVVDAILAHEPAAAFLLHTGDLALNLPLVSGDDKGYTEFFAVERQLLANKPLFTVLGNHETIDTTYFDSMFDAARFNGAAHPYFSSLNWGQLHLALIDAFEGTPAIGGFAGRNPGVSAAQEQWLDADLAAALAAGKTSFVAVHQGAYSHAVPGSGHGGLTQVEYKVNPLMIRYGVLASFAGHDHFYERGREGCIDYLVVGGGGAPMYAPDPAAAGVAKALQTNSYVVVSVAADGSATMVAKDKQGAVIDSFSFVVPDGAPCGWAGSDGGSDAGSADAGGGDAGRADSGSDAGADAGAGADGGVDAGADAGLRDAGSAPDGGDPLGALAGSGCGCSGGSVSPLDGLAALLALGWLRRARLNPRRG